MRITTTLAAAASIAVLSTTSFAGSMSAPVVEVAPVAMPEPVKTSSVSPTYVIVGILAALIAVAAQ